ncbi:MAG: GTPase HflX [Clostridiales bacterium]|jgi:GTP-binding protein HflX|nr:GTPase HflX [Clostridiales bacterium]
MNELNGNLSGIRDSVKQELLALYEAEVASDEFLPQDLAAELARLTALVRREISVYLARNGQVLDVSVGQADRVSLQDLGQRRSEQRLSRVRCIHTHPNGDPMLSEVDIAALTSLRLDAICALGVSAEGSLTGASLALLSPDESGVLKAGNITMLNVSLLDHPQLMTAIAANDQLVTTGMSVTADDIERAFLVSTDSQTSLNELAALAESAGAVVVGSALQMKTKPDSSTYIGSGKASEVSLEAQAREATLVIVDDELTGIQNSRLEDLLGLPVIDRTTLILDIFAQRAVTSEGKLQVSLAQLNYRASHLIGARASLSRLGGGIGTRGPGESKLEMDRRVIRNRIQFLRGELKELERQRGIRRKNRISSDVPNVALVGYTNTGKSTLLNAISGADVLVKDQLFATLDTVSRKIATREGDEFLLTDSVGFISKLPTDLVEAFRSTLDEAMGADVLVIVSDASSPFALEQRKAVEEVLSSLGASEQPRIEVYNKWDIALPEYSKLPPGTLRVSAKTGYGMEDLLSAITEILRKRERVEEVLIPFESYHILNEIRGQGRIIQENHEDQGTRVTYRAPLAAAQKIRAQYPSLFEKKST